MPDSEVIRVMRSFKADLLRGERAQMQAMSDRARLHRMATTTRRAAMAPRGLPHQEAHDRARREARGMRKISAVDIEAWRRRKLVYERRQKGETQRAIAHDLGISIGRVVEIEKAWRHALEYFPDKHPWYERLYIELCRAGVIVPLESVIYGYA